MQDATLQILAAAAVIAAPLGLVCRASWRRRQAEADHRSLVLALFDRDDATPCSVSEVAPRVRLAEAEVHRAIRRLLRDRQIVAVTPGTYVRKREAAQGRRKSSSKIWLAILLTLFLAPLLSGMLFRFSLEQSVLWLFSLVLISQRHSAALNEKREALRN